MNKEVYKSRYRVLYNEVVVQKLKDSLNLKNVMQVPVVQKIVINACFSQAITDSKKLNKIKDELALISGQAPVFTLARRSLASFHLREGMPIGVKVTLRKDNMYDFLDKLINIAMPRIKDFNAYKTDSNFDHHGNFNFGITDQTIFPEINYDSIDFLWGMNITIVTNSRVRNHVLTLLKEFNFPFLKV
jgi:large subunit ribosomal protein L5